MLNISYNVSQDLKKSLQKIENQRRIILITPISLKTELKLKWEATVKRIHWSLSFGQNTLTESEISHLLSNTSQKRLPQPQQDALRYKKASDYILQEWYVNSKPVTPKIVQYIRRLYSPGSPAGDESKLKELLDYIQTNPENPVIQAAIVQIELMSLYPFSDENERISMLMPYLFLYKNGYDFRGLLVLEKSWRKNLVSFRANIQECLRSGNLTVWLEFFALAVSDQLTESIREISSELLHNDFSPFWEINDRQKEILSFLEQPEISITNKKVRKMFKISQITASRDLAKLTTLGLLFPRGKGRSVSYTRV